MIVPKPGEPGVDGKVSCARVSGLAGGEGHLQEAAAVDGEIIRILRCADAALFGDAAHSIGLHADADLNAERQDRA